MRNNTKPVLVTYSVVAGFQYRENYGAHDWDGTGECPNYWKFKGGEEVILATSLTYKEALRLSQDRRIHSMARMHEYSSEFATNECIYIVVECAYGPTQEEIWDAYDRGEDLEEEFYGQWGEMATEPLDRWDALTEELGFLNA